jgi:alpha-N-acetylglucosamine transferase
MFRSPSRTTLVLCGFAMLSAVAIFATTYSIAAAEDKEQAKGELRHVVLVQFKKDATKEQIQEVVTAFGAMRKKIDVITGFEWGTDVSVENLAQGFTHCFIVTFKDSKARDHYLPHPVHEEFKKLAIPRIEKVMVVDFYVQK